MEGRVNEADKRASILASEKRQLESTRLRLESEAEAERARFENALAKQRSEYENALAKQRSEYSGMNTRDSISTSDDTLVTERSMGNSLEIKGDAFAMGSLDIRADAYEADLREDEKSVRVPSSPQLWLASEPATNLRTPEAKGDDMTQDSQSMDQDRVARVLHQLALECDKQSTRDINIRASAPSHLLPPIAAATSLRSTLNGFPASEGRARHSVGAGHQHGQEVATSRGGATTRVDRPSSPPPSFSLLSAGGSAPANVEEMRGLSRVSSSGDEVATVSSASPGQPRVLSTRRSLRMHDTNDDESSTPRTPQSDRAPWAEEIFCKAVAAEAAQKRRNSSVAAAAAASSPSASPKPKGRSLGLMLDATRVARVVRGSPAHQAGLITNDRLMRVNGIRVVKDDVGKILRMQVRKLPVMRERRPNPGCRLHASTC